MTVLAVGERTDLVGALFICSFSAAKFACWLSSQ